MFIPDPTFFHLESRIRTVSIPDPGSLSKNLSILTQKKAKQKNGFQAQKNMIRAVHPGSRIRMLTWIPDRDADFLTFRIRIRSTVLAHSEGLFLR
jgi:hypothetical protein